jgi:hypothetical protein
MSSLMKRHDFAMKALLQDQPYPGDLAKELADRVIGLEHVLRNFMDMVSHERNMMCQDMNLQMQASAAVDEYVETVNLVLEKKSEIPEYIETLQADLMRSEQNVEKLTAALIEANMEILSNAYATGHERDGEWTHCFMSDGEYLASICGFKPKESHFPADQIKDAIPDAARRLALDVLQEKS